MKQHTDPQQCLELLVQSATDGGVHEYVRQSLGEWDVREVGEGYCAIAALVHAELRPPTGQAYADMKRWLQRQQSPHAFRQRRVDESFLRYALRRLKQLFVHPTFDPSDGTPSHAIYGVLIPLGYRVICPNPDHQWHCICDPRCLYVLDVILHGSGHTMTVHDGTCYTTAPFDPAHTRVINVYRLPPAQTKSLVAYRKYEAEHQAWHDNMEQNIRNRVPIPKLDDY